MGVGSRQTHEVYDQFLLCTFLCMDWQLMVVGVPALWYPAWRLLVGSCHRLYFLLMVCLRRLGEKTTASLTSLQTWTKSHTNILHTTSCRKKSSNVPFETVEAKACIIMPSEANILHGMIAGQILHKMYQKGDLYSNCTFIAIIFIIWKLFLKTNLM